MTPLPNAPTVSVVVVSRGRPDTLTLCLMGLAQCWAHPVEIVVVADPQGLAAAEATGLALKTVAFDQPNISAARNRGIAQAAGDLIAFIDDDAVPEPSWLGHLLNAFSVLPDLAGAGGYVRGRNGISFQWEARALTQDAETPPIEAPGDAPFVPDTGDCAVKTEGTNMIFRADVLRELGGFDESFHFYLDETDLNWRLHEAGARVALVPLAQVVHGTAPSDQRAADRAPRSLHQIGASLACWALRRALPDTARDTMIDRARTDQRNRLLRHMVRGGAEPRDIARLLAGFDAGVREGYGRSKTALRPLAANPPPLKPLHETTPPARHVVVSARSRQFKALARRARSARETGAVVSALRLSLTGLPHKMRFTREGIWLQTGGIFGPSERSDPAFRLSTLRRRTAREQRRLARLRDSPL